MDIYIQIQNLIPFLKVLWLIDILVGRNVCWRGGKRGRRRGGKGKERGEEGLLWTQHHTINYCIDLSLLHAPPPLNKTGRIDKYLHLHFLFDIHCKRKRPINTICLNYGPTKGRNEGRGRL